jgi:TetR/AcrR family transcriptional repressor of bet genes
VACWVALAAEAVRDPAVRRPYAQEVGQLIGRLEKLVAEALPARTRADGRRIAAAIFAAIQGYFVLAATCHEAVPAGSAARSTREMALGLLSSARPGRASLRR